MDQLIIGDKASFDDFAASVATRKIKMPKKKSIRETVPFSNVTYDFSAINGETYWEDRELEYVFELTADDPEELEELKTKFAAWVMSVQGQELHDPYIPDYHFLATYDDMDPVDDEGLDKCTITVKFTAYPYKIANVPKVYEVILKSGTSATTFYACNESDHPISLTISTPVDLTVTIVDKGWEAILAGTRTCAELKLPVGRSAIEISNPRGVSFNATISFAEEVF